MNGSPASFRRSRAATVLAICIRLRMPSCIRAPPDDWSKTTGQPLGRGALEEARDLLARHAAHRPAHEREEERAPRDGDARSMRARPISTDSLRGPADDFFCAEATRSGYPLPSTKSSGSVGSRCASHSSTAPSSASSARQPAAPSLW